MQVNILPVTPDKSSAYLHPFSQAIGLATGVEATIRAGFAYATFAGANQMCGVCNAQTGWDDARKLFLVGLHHGITEPAALTLLRSLPNAEVRIIVPDGRLSMNALYSRRIFHPKVLAVSESSSSALAFLQAGSANLTGAAIGDAPSNYEFGLAITAAAGHNVEGTNEFMAWWAAAWALGRIVNPAVIRKYADLRAQMLKDNPLLRAAIITPHEIGSAMTLFIEVGAGSGPVDARHQVEFPKAIATYFGKPKQGRRDLTLVSGTKAWSDRPLSFKQTTFGVDIWRLGMPTEAKGGVPVAKRVVRFDRTDKKWAFRFEVFDVNSPLHERCISDANLHGHLGTTGGPAGRQFGFYG